MNATAETIANETESKTAVQSVDAATLCRILDCNAQTIHNYAHSGIILKTGIGQYPLWDSIRRVVRHLREQAGNTGSTEEIMELRREKLLHENAMRKIRLEHEAGLLISAEDAERMWSDLAAAARDELLSLPPKLKSEIESLYGIDIESELFAEPIERALRQIASWNPRELPQGDEARAAPVLAES